MFLASKVGILKPKQDIFLTLNYQHYKSRFAEILAIGLDCTFSLRGSITFGSEVLPPLPLGLAGAAPTNVNILKIKRLWWVGYRSPDEAPTWANWVR